MLVAARAQRVLRALANVPWREPRCLVRPHLAAAAAAAAFVALAVRRSPTGGCPRDDRPARGEEHPVQRGTRALVVGFSNAPLEELLDALGRLGAHAVRVEAALDQDATRHPVGRLLALAQHLGPRLEEQPRLAVAVAVANPGASRRPFLLRRLGETRAEGLGTGTVWFRASAASPLCGQLDSTAPACAINVYVGLILSASDRRGSCRVLPSLKRDESFMWS
mmetsp:Transcript_32822/g.103178  ORF Transcript_32822/g.103178 Transcript_32822/m.103178 type:complete len:222 (+) Transcript_32822:681-1346(+)